MTIQMRLHVARSVVVSCKQGKREILAPHYTSVFQTTRDRNDLTSVASKTWGTLRYDMLSG